jgi:UDP-hydrolysing UDP-N-acetyl-D-glucosamine 2-epimerase
VLLLWSARLRSICVVTGSRAEYGLLYWLIREIAADPDLKLQVIATGMHLSPEFGLTYQAIEADGIRIDAKVETLLSSDTPVGVSKSIGLGVIGFADAFARLGPDIVVLLGDRYEILAAAEAAMVARIPIAHVHGGEVTVGAIDDAIRHAITKMSQFHFVAAEAYRKRVIQLGESPSRVINVGAPGLDHLHRTRLLGRSELEHSLGFRLGKVNFLVTYHPATLGNRSPAEGMTALLTALDQYPDAHVIFTKPNADVGGRGLISMLDDYVLRNASRALAAVSLGQLHYLSAMAVCDAVIGNSSSGIIEAPALGRASVNIGERQQGRLRAASVIDCPEEAEAITAAIGKALSSEFSAVLEDLNPPYGAGGAAERIKARLASIDLAELKVKHFHDL